MIKYNFSKQILEEKYSELKTIYKVADYFNIPQTSMGFIFKKLGIKHIKIFKASFNEIFLSNETPETFYLAGFLAADGNVDKNLRRITIGLSEKDLDFLNKIKSLINFEGNITKNISRGSKRNKKYKDTVSYFMRFSSKQTANDLKRFNIVPNKTKIYDMQEWLMDHPLVNHFMRGYNDGDGCLRYDDGQLSFKLVGNLSFLTKYQSILENSRFVNHNKITKDRNVFVLKYTGNIIVPKICQLLYNNSTFHLERKYNLYARLANKL